jgi:hypothetical protein
MRFPFIDSEQEEKRTLIKVSQTEAFCTREHIMAHIFHTKSFKQETPDVIVGDDVYNDIEMFASYTGDSKQSIFNSLFETTFKGSQYLLEDLVSRPITDSLLLRKRQSFLNYLENNIEEISNKLNSIKHTENDVLWFFEQKDDTIKAIYDMVFFNWWILKKMNQSGTVLTTYNTYRMFLSPLFGILSPVIYFVVPYIILRYRLKLRIGFYSYLKILMQSSKLVFKSQGWSDRLYYGSYLFSLIFYFQGIFNSIDISRTLYNISDSIIGRTQNILKFLNESQHILASWNTMSMNQCFFTELAHSIQYEPTNYTDINETRKWIWTNYGDILKVYKTLDKEMLRKNLVQLYMFDSISTIVCSKVRHNLSYSKYTNRPTPCFIVKDFWHPCLKENAIKNSVYLGNGEQQNMIITGPNAGGKSTLIKSLLINVILSQTIAVSCSEYTVITPFRFINSQINIPDCKGKESLFEAEMSRCKYSIKTIQRHKEFSFVVMDEVFNSTNPVEGISGAYAVASKLGRDLNTLTILTTHFLYLTKLSKTCPSYHNYRMNVMKANGPSAYEFPYKLEKGVSTQYIALELLEKNGFDTDVIEEAKRIRDEICV